MHRMSRCVVVRFLYLHLFKSQCSELSRPPYNYETDTRRAVNAGKTRSAVLKKRKQKHELEHRRENT